MTYNTTTRSFTMEDASGSYSWIVEGMSAKECIHLTDAAIYEWIDGLIAISKEMDRSEIEERAETQTYPKMGYTTSQVFENDDEYLTYKHDEIDSDYASERARVFEFIKAWIDNALLPTDEAATYAGVHRQTIKNWDKHGILSPVEHFPRFNLYRKADLDAAKALPRHPGGRKPAPRAQG
jgi:hypothetical protein